MNEESKNLKAKLEKLFPEGLSEPDGACSGPECCGGPGTIDRTDDVLRFIKRTLKADRLRILELVKKHYLSGVRNSSDLAELESKILNP